MKNLKRYHQLFENNQELTQEQKDWLDKCTNGTWRVNPQTGLVDVDGDFDCRGQNLTDFKGVRFGNVSGIFICYRNELKSLDGAPQSVGTYFDCGNNNLKSLEGLPDGFKVGGSFDCSNNNLTSLEGAPQRVDENIYCHNNPISERAIKRVLKRMSVGFSVGLNISLEQAVAEYWKWTTQEDRVYLAKHHPTLPEEEKRIYRGMELNMKRR